MFELAAAEPGCEARVTDAAVCSNVCIYQFLVGDDSTILSLSPKALCSIGNQRADLRVWQ